ncbi:Vacuolar protein sorting 2 (Vps2) [Monocercomonoides exilis]|uniref:Vacuolar protein sorting 2 (Vps2) n=1 Tax=Monocercomonoides exilis TaxID=2049356 RepID=UPI0035595163|nr:Vacuolar protein sorting 2 (Vps2) [Monocercomonoides exilis]|eukprot:MONOS_16838.1-p1 / transcript=MONOS_16838.1 / gene=MONOS_16838 / organism=Monocercomonoides_exilis_PA203 / gene_product= Vacuolar protein sorting 2 (Vps2) / transcript_product= Vacuolar protein sorting 2 (Vps2) / location=Mono_scaffold00128:56243-57150(-) / protein_length=211 / sequence_SO=supercontig / SO=protein_coding / is_pseudo=false
MGIFGDSKPANTKDQIRQNKRIIEKAIREIDRERTRLQQEEQRHGAELKKAAKEGHSGACKIIAKNILRTRAATQRMYTMRTNLNALSLRIQTASSQEAMITCMKGVTKIMTQMNKKISAPEMSKIMMEFQKQSETMDMKMETMEDAMDDAFEEDDEEEESEKLIQSVLDEFSITIGSDMKTPSGSIASSSATPASDADLQARIDALRRS